MPAVNYDLMLQEMLSKTDGKVTRSSTGAGRSTGRTRRSRPIRTRSTSWRSSTPRTARSCSTCRPAILTDRSTPTSSPCGRCRSKMPGCSAPTRARAGKYLVLPPGYADKAPDGYIALQSDTFGGYMLFRSNLKSHSSADVARIRSSTASESRSIRWRRRQSGGRPSSPTSRTSTSTPRSVTTRASSNTSIASCRANPGCSATVR